jgi:IS30 family transposase
MRPRFPRELEARFWRAVSVTSSAADAAVVAGVSARTGVRLFAEAGGVRPEISPPTLRLSFQERCRIEAMLAVGLSHAGIARRLGRSPATVSREVRRNATLHGRAGYRAANAQSKADARARRPKPGRLAAHPRLREQVQNRLEEEHSPRQIAHRLRRDFPDHPEMWVSHETIYKALYVQGRGELRRDLTRRLRTGRTLRKPRRSVGERRGRIPGMVNISQRPAEVADRAVPGHWEGDLILGSTASSSAIGTLVERASRFVMLLHLPDGHGADAVADAMVAAMARLPERLRQTLTWDQGHEMTNHARIAAATELDIYFCDPHSPWQRGSNENTNGLLRQYFPKGTDLSVYQADYLDHVARKLNTRPRETLDWRTPAETLDELLSNPTDPPGIVLTG